jgi:plasmid stabilization system protein ParE
MRASGDTFLTAVEEAVALLADWPRSGVRVDNLGDNIEVRRAPILRFSYHLAYTVSNDDIRILAVAHDRRRPRYWAPRAQRQHQPALANRGDRNRELRAGRPIRQPLLVGGR